MATEPDKRMKDDKQKNRQKDKKRETWLWVIKVVIFSFSLSFAISFLNSELVNSISVIVALLLLLSIVAIGIISDTIGLAVATADETPFHSMAARKLREGRHAVFLIRNADKVSSICNDVVGDIAGVVSGATGAAIVANLAFSEQANFWLSLTVTGLISAMTVGGKAIGKTIALERSNRIVYLLAKIMCVFSRKK